MKENEDQENPHLASILEVIEQQEKQELEREAYTMKILEEQKEKMRKKSSMKK